MPWIECKPMNEYLRFIARLLEGEKIAPVCREFGISRVTSYKIYNRYRECGLDALNDRSRSVNRHRKLTHYRRRILTHPEMVFCINLCA